MSYCLQNTLTPSLQPPKSWRDLEEISSLSHSVVFLYFCALIAEEGFLISSCYSLELCIQMLISFLFRQPFYFFAFLFHGDVIFQSCDLPLSFLNRGWGHLYKFMSCFWASRGRAESFFVSVSPQLPSAQNHSYAKVAYLGAVHSATLIALWVGSQLPILGHHCRNSISTLLNFFGDCEPSPSTSCLDHTGFSDSGRWCHPVYPYSYIPEVVSLW